MIHIALCEPEIAPNTGNIIRLCANSGAKLHLIHPLGFALDNKRMQRAGLDYHEFSEIIHHNSLKDFIECSSALTIIPCETNAKTVYSDYHYHKDCILLFGSETRGLPEYILQQYDGVTIPMQSHSRSLNLSNAVAIILYEALRQLNFSFES